MVCETDQRCGKDTVGVVSTKSQVLESEIKNFLISQGETDREDLQETPGRFLKAMQEMLGGYEEDPAGYLSKQFKSSCDEMILVKDIPFVSLCEHHMLPFWGTATVAYVPAGTIVGLSKIPRAVQALARRLQVQERLTDEIATALQDNIKDCLGVGVRIVGEHSCMKFRGVKSSGKMTTSKLTGVFRKHSPRAEFLSLCGE